jgi:2-octaprenyl-6-methoxyphenol hydroxylase
VTAPPDYDVVIAGGGLAGASLACALADKDCRIGVVETLPLQAEYQPSYDDRGLALALSSQRILEGLGLWAKLARSASPIRHVHISDRSRFGFVRLDAGLLNVPALGYVVIARAIGKVLLNHLQTSAAVDLHCPAEVISVRIEPDDVKTGINMNGTEKTLTSRLFVAADGTNSKARQLLGITAREKDYGQRAIVSNISPARPHKDTAYERFTASGPIALLPLTEQRCAVVFTVHTGEADRYLTLDDDAFIACLQARFGCRLGRFLRVGTRRSYDLKLVSVTDQVRDRVVLLGNSAHTLHPNAAQGFNLGLRDVAGLAEHLVPALREGRDVGSRQLLENYLASRRKDQQRVLCFTDSIAATFYNDLPYKVLLRDALMLATDLVPFLKRSFLREAMALSGHQPALVRGLPL